MEHFDRGEIKLHCCATDRQGLYLIHNTNHSASASRSQPAPCQQGPTWSHSTTIHC